jgi:hypothetical protein
MGAEVIFMPSCAICFVHYAKYPNKTRFDAPSYYRGFKRKGGSLLGYNIITASSLH